MGIWNKVLKPFQAVADWVGNASKKTGEWISNAWEDTTQWVGNAWEDTTQWLGNAWDTINGKSKDIYGASFTDITEQPSEIMMDIATGKLGDGIISQIEKNKDNPIIKDIETGITDKMLDNANKIAPLFGEDRLEENEIDKIKKDLQDGLESGPLPTTPTPTTTQKGTGENEINDIKALYDEMRANDLADQQRQWEREDELRKEQYAREDSAYSRAVADMRKSGINPELVGISPLSSGSASINTANINNSSGNMINSLSTIITSKISNEVKIDENQKDRINDIIRSAITLLLLKGK